MNPDKKFPISQREEQAMNTFKDYREESIMIPAYERAISILETQSLKVEMFADTYNEDLLKKHASYVDNCETLFEQQRQSSEAWTRAEIFGKTLEGILHHQINEGIYGEDVRGVSTTSYDDYYAGIDEVIERQSTDGSTYIGCAIDFTFGNPKNKVDNILDSIKAGVLNDIIYYESPFGDPPHIHGKLQGIPKVVVGMDASNLVSLAEQWNENDVEGLHNNHLFLSILRQIQMQAEVYQIVAKRLQKTEVATRYEKIYNSITNLYNEQKQSKGITMLDSKVTSDSVNLSLREQMHELLERK